MIISFLLYVVIGLLSGVLAGLFGLGGGVVIVPALIAMGLSAHIATSSSLAVIVFTSVMTVWSQQRREAVAWDYLRYLIPGMIVGIIFGVLWGHQLSSRKLQNIFAVFCILLAIKMVMVEDKIIPTASVFSKKKVLGGAILAGMLSGLLGVGGGIILIPMLIALGLPLAKISGTTAACVFPTAVVGTFIAALASLHTSGLPFYSTGYIYWPAVIVVGMGSVGAVPVGVYLSHRLPDKMMKKIFGGILLLVAWQMIRQ